MAEQKEIDKIEVSERCTVIVIGAAGVIGKRLLQQLIKKKYKIVAALRKTPLPDNILNGDDNEENLGHIVCEFGLDLRNDESVDQLIAKYSNELCAVCNFAAPLSVESEKDPSAAEDTTVGGMKRLIHALDKSNVPSSVKILFSDSIGSYGAESPRLNVEARWLTQPENQNQDPGSEYGRQKRRCRMVLSESKYDTRWGIIPGVLHDDSTWGDGTTEYALDAIKTFHEAYQGKEQSSLTYTCPVNSGSMLPMIHISDLILGLVSLLEADKTSLQEPESGYAFAGFSFTPLELFSELNSHLSEKYPTTPARNDPFINVKYDASGSAALFADLWPDSISGEAALRDLAWRPVQVPSLRDAISRIVSAHAM